ncbi:MAG: FliH/SctL family protein [Hyphomicrobiales bacterium]
MAAPAKYLFDIDFAARESEPVEERPVVDLAAHEAALAAAEKRGHAKGLAEGRAAAEAAGANRLAEEAGRLAKAADAIFAALDEDRLRAERFALELALTTARKIAPALVAREPLAEIEALIAECLGPLRHTPHLVIRLNDAHVEALRAHVDRLAYEKGFEGRLVILGEPDFAPGDCRIEWADGGIVRDAAEVEATIIAAIERYLAARAATGHAAGHDRPPGHGHAAGPEGDLR